VERIPVSDRHQRGRGWGRGIRREDFGKQEGGGPERSRRDSQKAGKRPCVLKGGIVADSDAKYGFQETVNNAEAMLRAIALAETFR
jgi:hypothetical protein